MPISEIFPFIKQYIEELNTFIKRTGTGKALSKTQAYWLGFCLSGILITNSICWKKFERLSFGLYTQKALSWMFHHSLIDWNLLFATSIASLLNKYEIKYGTLAIDDSDRPRSKKTSRIYGTHKTLDKKTNGFMMAQNVVMLLLVTPRITLPVGFYFYRPDPQIKLWEKEDKRLRVKKVKKKERPQKPKRDKNYPTKQDIAIKLVETFKRNHPDVNIEAIVADALFMSETFLQGLKKSYSESQIISQIKCNQKVMDGNKEKSVEDYFKDKKETSCGVLLRGHIKQEVRFCHARLKICSHSKKELMIVALKYEGETQYRYLAVSDVSYRAKDIIEIYAYRWLIEVFFEDWKSYGGFGSLALQQGDDGSHQGVILSLLIDHSLFYSEQQSARLEKNLPAATVGSLRATLMMDYFFQSIHRIIESVDPKKHLIELIEKAEGFFELRDSTKHMSSYSCIFKCQPEESAA